MTALLVDFEDSFTYNIAQYLDHYRIPYRVVQWQNYRDRHCETLIILGPGPGVVFDYRKFLEQVNCTRNFYFGICLGHQLLGVLHGFELYRHRPMHGQVVSTKIPHWGCFPQSTWGRPALVQRYNSWSLRKGSGQVQGVLSSDGMFLFGHHFLSYQFHPESIGTSCPHLFFESAFKLAYNKYYGRTKTSHFRNL